MGLGSRLTYIAGEKPVKHVKQIITAVFHFTPRSAVDPKTSEGTSFDRLSKKALNGGMLWNDKEKKLFDDVSVS